MISKDTLWWFFSANAQVFGALIGILGVFTIYIFQTIEQAISFSADEAARVMKRVIGSSDYFVFSLKVRLKEIADQIKHQRERNNDNPAIVEVETILKTIESMNKKKTDVRNELSKLVFLLSGVLVGSIVFLAFAEQLSLHQSTARMSLSLVLVCSVVSVVQLAIFIKQALINDVAA